MLAGDMNPPETHGGREGQLVIVVAGIVADEPAGGGGQQQQQQRRGEAELTPRDAAETASDE